tara:strand:- start:2154 stop:2360 length:207 start_codon:yes stop_codon:yes gene_type:complete
MEINTNSKKLTPEALQQNHRISSLKYAMNNRQKIRDYSNKRYALNKDKILAKRRERRRILKQEKLDAK